MMARYNLQTELAWNPRWDALYQTQHSLCSNIRIVVQTNIRERVLHFRTHLFDIRDQLAEDLSW